MALQRQSAEFPFLKGVAHKRHPHRQLIPGLTDATNVSFEEPGAIIKRRGFADIGATVIDDSSAPSSWDRVDALGKRLLLWGGAELYEYAQGPDELVPISAETGRGTVVSGDSEIAPIGSAFAYDSLYAYTNGYELYAAGSFGTWKVFIREQATGVRVASFSAGAASSPQICGRAIAVGNTLMFFAWTATSTLTVYRWDTASPPASVTPQTVASDMSTTATRFDVATDGTDAYVAYSTTAPTIKVAKVSTAGTVGTTQTFDTVAADLAICVYVTTAVLVAYADSTGGLEVQGLSTALATVSSHTLDAGATSTSAIVIGGADASSRATVIYGDGDDIVIDRVNLDGSSNTYSARTLYGPADGVDYDGISIASKPLTHATGLYLAIARGTSEDNSTVLVRLGVSSDTDDDAEPVTVWRYLAESAGDQHNAGMMSEIVSTPLGYRLAGIGKVLTGARADVPLCILYTFAVHGGRSTEAMGALYMSGSLYAGGQVEQVGFPWPPRITSVTTSNGAGSLDNNGVYRWIAIYAYTDSAGNTHYSPPSLPSDEITLGASDDTAQVTVTAPLMREGVSAYAIIYRTTNGGSIYYFDQGAISTIKSAGTSAIQSLPSDATIATRRTLYTEGGLLGSYPPPPGGEVVLHNNRLWCIAENGDLWPSRELVQGEAPAWNPALAVQVGGRVEKPVALASGGDGGPLVVLFRKRIAHLYGEGPNDQGLGGSFSQLQYLEGVNAGTDNPRSVCTSPDGVWFDDPDHGSPWLLPHGASVPIHVGADAEDYFTEDVVAAHVLHDRKEVRFFLGERQWAVYCYEDELRDERGRGQWSLSTAAGLGTEDIVDAAILSGRSVYVTDGGTIRHERTAAGNKLDGTTYYNMQLDTGFISLGGIQGLKRVWDLQIIGQWVDNHGVQVLVAADRRKTNDPAGFSTSTTFGWTDAEISALSEYELECHLVDQLVKVLRLRISDDDDGTNNGDSFKLTGLRVDYGVSPGRRTLTTRKGADAGA